MVNFDHVFIASDKSVNVGIREKNERLILSLFQRVLVIVVVDVKLETVDSVIHLLIVDIDNRNHQEILTRCHVCSRNKSSIVVFLIVLIENNRVFEVKR